MRLLKEPVEEFVGKNVDPSYSPKFADFEGVYPEPYPQMFFSVYRDLRDLLGFPRPLLLLLVFIYISNRY